MKLEKNLSTTLPAGLCLGILLMLSGCLGIGGGDAQPILFYTLEPSDVPELGLSEQAGAIHIGLGKVEIPDYLDRKEIVIRTQHNELRYTGNHLWAERLGGSLPRVLAQNITRQMEKPALVHSLPWADAVEPELSVSAEVHSFEGQQNPSSEVLFEISWTIQSIPDGTVLRTGSHQGNGINWDAGNYSDLADSLSEQLKAAGRLIGKDVSEIYETLLK